jgi:protein tyrosine phosphatase (PTP) superfamily phosphohydrolase (DUF442 family)
MEFSSGLYSGSAPHAPEGFTTLSSMGVKTIISVDGALPDVPGARLRGIRYVHLPIGYHGMDDSQRLALARAVRDLPGSVYVHCHHGKHRSAAAAGAIAVTLGRATPEQMVSRMTLAGTSGHYPGLFACVKSATPASESELARADAHFPERAEPRGLVGAMIEIDAAHDRLALVEAAGWNVPREHPDLVPAAEAGRLADHFRLLMTNEHVGGRSANFAAGFEHAARLANDLEARLVSGSPARALLSEHFNLMTQSCRDCHAKHRD